MSEHENPYQASDLNSQVPARTNGLATASLILGLISICGSFITGIPAMICGVIALIQISGSRGQQKGTGFAIGGIASGGLFSVMVCVALLLPAIMSVRSSAEKIESTNKLRNIALAMLMNEQETGEYPQDIVDKDGTPLLSWRVKLLPYLERDDLYQQFHLDESWDSPHNMQLIAQMPELYLSPGTANLEDGKTCYLAPSGKELIVGSGKKWRLGEISARDGVANTIAYLEVDPSEAQIWTKPADLDVDLANPKRGLGSLRPGGFIVVLADSHATFLSNEIDPETLSSMFTPAGGEIFTSPE